MSSSAPDFSLPNVGPGPDPFTLAAAETDFVVLFFQRDYHCTNCRGQVQTIADHIDAFRERNAQPVSILPEPVARAQQWQAEYTLPYPLLADPDKTVADAYDQPVRFGFLGNLSDFLGRMPAIVVIDCRSETPRIVVSHRGRSTFDRPTIKTVLGMIDDAQ